MAYIDSSTNASPLAAAAKFSPVSDEPETTDSPEEEQREDDGEKQSGEEIKANLIAQIDVINIADDLSDEDLNTLGALVVREFEIDELSRSEWKDMAEKAMKFATQKTEEKVYPWPKSSNIVYPLITQAALQFNARTLPAIIQNRNIVKGVVWGSDKGTPSTLNGKPDGAPQMHPDGTPVWLSAPGEKRTRADRIGEHMSWQLLDEMEEWEPQTDQLLATIPIIGGASRKTYWDPSEKRNRSLFVRLQDLVWNYYAPSFESAPRHTEIITLYPIQVEEKERAGEFLHIDYGPGEGPEDKPEMAQNGDEDAPHEFLEQHRNYDLDGDGYPEPYICTVHRRSSRVVRIVARYDEDCIHMSEDGDEVQRIDGTCFYTLIPFLPNIEGGSYPMGFGHLLKPINEGINTTLNQMFDAGHLQNAGGGFISNKLSMKSGPATFQVGKYIRVDSNGMNIRDAVFPLPFAGPSPVLFQLLGVLMNAGKEVASIQDILAGDAAMANASPTTVLALIEQGSKLYTAIHKRIYRAFKSEFQKLYALNRKYLTEEQRYRIGDEWREITPDDYRLGGGVEPIADPTMVTDMQKLGRAQVLMTFKDDPMINQKEIRTRFLEAANIDRVEELFVPPDPMMQQNAQLEMAMKQAELGRVRAAEMKDQTQAYLNLAEARAKASAPEQEFIEKQLTVLRLHIEAVNATTRAAMVDHKFHDTKMRQIANDAKLNGSATPSA